MGFYFARMTIIRKTKNSVPVRGRLTKSEQTNETFQRKLYTSNGRKLMSKQTIFYMAKLFYRAAKAESTA